MFKTATGVFFAESPWGLAKRQAQEGMAQHELAMANAKTQWELAKYIATKPVTQQELNFLYDYWAKAAGLNMLALPYSIYAPEKIPLIDMLQKETDDWLKDIVL